MPKLNARGDVICGVAGVQGSLNGRPYPFRSEGRGCWYDDTTILVAPVDRDPGVWLWRPFDDPAGAVLIRIDLRTFNAIAGGGGRWAACIQGTPSLLFGSLGDIHNGGIPSVAPDGTILYPNAYPSDFGLTVVAPGAAPVVIPDGVALYHQALPGGQAIWSNGGHPVPALPALPAVDLRLVTLEGARWDLYWSEGVGIVLQPDGEDEGYVIALPNGYDNDLSVRDGKLLAVLGLSQGEGPNDYLLLEATRAGARYVGREGPPIVWKTLGTPPDPPTNPPPVVHVASVTPTTGEAPLTVRAVAAIESGPVDRLEWWVRSAGDTAWLVDANNPADDLDHHFRFDAAGDYEIRVHAIGPGGTSDADGPAITVTPADTPEPPIPPQPPEDTMQRCVVDTHAAPIGGFDGEVIDNGNGTCCLRDVDGKYLSMDSEGHWNLADSPGPDETFQLGSNGLISVNTFAGRRVRLAACSTYEER